MNDKRDIIIRKAEQLEKNLVAQLKVIERQNKRYSENRLFHIYLGKVFGMYELLKELGLEKEAESLEWTYKFGI